MTMTKEDLIEVAERVALQRIILNNYGMMNQPTKTEDRVKLDAHIMIARDKLLLLEQEYTSALRAFDLATWPSPSKEDAPQ